MKIKILHLGQFILSFDPIVDRPGNFLHRRSLSVFRLQDRKRILLGKDLGVADESFLDRPASFGDKIGQAVVRELLRNSLQSPSERKRQFFIPKLIITVLR